MFAYITAAPQVVMGELHFAPAHFGWVFGPTPSVRSAVRRFNARLARRILGDTLLTWAVFAALAAGLVLLACVLTGFGGGAGILVPLFVMLSAMGFSNPNAAAAAMSVDRNRAGATAALLGGASSGWAAWRAW